MEGGRSDPLFSVPTAWGLAGNSEVSFTSGKEKKVKVKLAGSYHTTKVPPLS